MDSRLREAALTGNFDYFYSLEGKANLLKAIDTDFFAETPLHVAVAAGQTAFAMEMMNLRPEFARTLNEDGFSPMHVALEMKKTQLAYRLLEMDKDIVRVKGREGKTPFHYVVGQQRDQSDERDQITEEITILSKFLDACPECIQDVTVHGDTALHIALKREKFEAFEFLVKWVRNNVHRDAENWEERVLNWKDEQGNTPLHIATMNYNLKAVKLLSGECSDVVDLNVKNADKLTVLEFISKCDDESDESHNVIEKHIISAIKRRLEVQNADPILDTLMSLLSRRRFLYLKRIEPPLRTWTHMSRRRKKISDDMRNALLVVTALIITATYQSCLSPPGGAWQGDNTNTIRWSNAITTRRGGSSGSGSGELHHPGATVMQNNTFSVLWSYNSLSLLMTIGLTVYLLPHGPLAFLLLAPLSLLCSSYMLSMSVLSPTPLWSKANRILSLLIFMSLIVPAYIYSWKSVRRVKGKYTLLYVRYDLVIQTARSLLGIVVMVLVVGLSVVAVLSAKLV